jgi:hypothetical protein
MYYFFKTKKDIKLNANLLKEISEKFLLNNNKLEKIEFYSKFYNKNLDTFITDEGLKYIVDGIKFNTTITKLDLQSIILIFNCYR